MILRPRLQKWLASLDAKTVRELRRLEAAYRSQIDECRFRAEECARAVYRKRKERKSA